MSKQPSSLQAFFAEMMRRRVFRVMAVYGATAFVLLQVADLLAEGMGLSDQVLRITTFLVLIGFPIAVVLAWAFESTPEGMKRTQPAAPEEIRKLVAAPLNQRWPAGLLALAGMGLLFWGGWWMGNRGADNPANIIVPEAQASAFKTIAALPFENVNGDDENRLIAVGVHDDLLTQLQRIAALRVTGSASVREYENTEKSFDEIAGELGVEYLLDGSVRSSGDRVRVVVALLDARSGEQLWREQYDEEVSPDNLFDIQSQIARQVVDALEAELTPRDRATLEVMAPGSDLAAQTRYHRAVELYTTAQNRSDEARDELLAAVEIDPDFVAAWSWLARIQSWLVQSGQAEDADARAARDRTVELAPGTVEAHLAAGYYSYYAQREFDAALSSFREAEKLAPSDSDVVWAVGLILRRQGDWIGSTQKLKRAVQLDPRNPLKLHTLRENLTNIGAHEDADAVAERILSINPGDPRARVTKVTTLAIRDGNFDRAQRLAGELGFNSADSNEAAWMAFFAFLDGDHDRAMEILDGIESRDNPIVEFSVQALKTNFLRMMPERETERRAAADSLLALTDVLDLGEATESQMRLTAYTGLQRWDDLRQEIAAAEAEIRRGEDAMLDPGWAESVAVAYGFLGELDAGFAWLEELADTPGGPGMNMEQAWFAPYHDDPRFEGVMAKYEAFVAEGSRKAETMRPFLP